MAYDFFLGKTQLPVPPAKLTVKINGRNQTMTLIDEGEINVLKKPGLTEVSFTALLPNGSYPFARSGGGAAVFLGELERMKTRRLPVQFIVSRVTPGGRVLFDTNLKVSLEDYKILEDTKNGFDVSVEIVLKQYKAYGTKTVLLKEREPGKTTAVTETKRPAETPPSKAAHTVVKGDCLWAIAQKYLGDGNRYGELYMLNQAEIDGGNRGTGNPRYTIYPGQVFKLP